jgi:hypothetical protein
VISGLLAPVLSDVLRWLLITGALVLVISAAFAIRYAEHGDQRIRFGLFALFSVLLTRGSILRLGEPASPWALPLLVAAVALAVWSTIKYVRRARAGHRE